MNEEDILMEKDAKIGKMNITGKKIQCLYYFMIATNVPLICGIEAKKFINCLSKVAVRTISSQNRLRILR